MCLGILNFTKKYSNAALEECCKQAIALSKQKYTFIKNTIPVIAEDMGNAGYNHVPLKPDQKRHGFVRDSKASDINNLLTRSQKLADQQREEGGSDAHRQ